MLHRDRNYFYLCDFHPDYAAISPGTLVTAHAIEHAAQRGAKYFDFLQGEEPYKYQKWGAQPRQTYRIQYARESTALRPSA
jgi:CelD/BcsL family acetyltransferase involved in cellulose biosynthesis